MITKHQLAGTIGVALATGVLQLAAVEQAAAQRPKGTATKPTTLAPAAPPTPSSAAIAKSVNAALQTALGKSTVRNAVRAEVIRQLRANAPVAHGVSDQNDNYPADPTKSICDCGRGRVWHSARRSRPAFWHPS